MNKAASKALFYGVASLMTLLLLLTMMHAHGEAMREAQLLQAAVPSRSEVLVRRMEAARILNRRKKKSASYTMTACSDPVLKNSRPREHLAQNVGQDCEAWWARDAVQAMEAVLLDAAEIMNGLEWGSGSSSQWAVTRMRSLISIEHDDLWFGRVKEYFDKGIGKELVTVSSEEDRLKLDWYGTGMRWRGILKTSSATGESRYIGSDRMYHKDYVEIAKTLIPLGVNPSSITNSTGFPADQQFDYISVDGRARATCLEIAIKMLKPDGGILVLDNSDRSRYQPGIIKVPFTWKRFDFDGGSDFGQTTIWISRKTAGQ